jgi:putative copper resistance protein D
MPGLFLADTLPPPLRGTQYLSTGFDAVPIILLLGVLALYVWGVVRANRLRPRHPWPIGRTLAMVGGVVSTGIAIFSFIGVYDSVLFWDHMIQHLILIMVAGALFAISSPMALLYRATTGSAHDWVKAGLRSGPAKFFAHPVVAFVLYALVIPISHLTSVYNWTLTHETFHDLEHVLFLVVGYLFWRQIFGIEPSAYKLHPAMKAVYLFIAVPVDTFVGLSLAGTDHELFPAYTAMHRTWGLPLVKDLRTGGTIMWVGGDLLMMLAFIPVIREWVHLEERRAARADRELEQAGYDVTPAGFGPNR